MPRFPSNGSGGASWVGTVRCGICYGEGQMMASQIQVGGRAIIGARQHALRIDGAEL